MAPVNVQQFLNDNPVLVIGALIAVGIILFLAARILLSSATCLVRLGCVIAVIVGIILLLRLLFVH